MFLSNSVDMMKNLLGSVHDARTKPRGGESQREDGAKKTSTKLKAFFAALS